MRILHKISSVTLLLLFVISGVGVTIVHSPCGMFSQVVSHHEDSDCESDDCDNCSDEEESGHTAQFTSPDQQCCTYVVSTVVKTEFENPTNSVKYFPTLIATILSTDGIYGANITPSSPSFQGHSPPRHSEIYIRNLTLLI